MSLPFRVGLQVVYEPPARVGLLPPARGKVSSGSRGSALSEGATSQRNRPLSLRTGPTELNQVSSDTRETPRGAGNLRLLLWIKQLNQVCARDRTGAWRKGAWEEVGEAPHGGRLSSRPRRRWVPPTLCNTGLSPGVARLRQRPSLYICLHSSPVERKLGAGCHLC